ncbi:MAG: cupin domain-containing protein [Cytophagales bacterium]|nr:cupin domain-containing protein [Cytophagales bacterium]
MNIFNHIPQRLAEELTEKIFESERIRIERIVSEGHSSPSDFWYDQEENEWVVLLEGEASLEYESGITVQMQKGDYVYIPAHKKHRVAHTSSNPKAVWLAILFI